MRPSNYDYRLKKKQFDFLKGKSLTRAMLSEKIFHLIRNTSLPLLTNYVIVSHHLEVRTTVTTTIVLLARAIS